MAKNRFLAQKKKHGAVIRSVFPQDKMKKEKGKEKKEKKYD